MLITYHGHSEFLLETEDGIRLLTDPYAPEVPWPYHETQADLVTCSHGHFDHAHLDKVQGNPIVLREAGEYTPLPGVMVTGYPSFHDDEGGAKRGSNVIFLYQMEDLRIAHLGDLGGTPADDVLNALHGLDILLIPVGGTYTLDAQQATQLVRSLKPRITIPMHYRRGEHGFPNIGTAEDFLSLFPQHTPAWQPLLRVAKGDIGEAPPLVALEAGKA